MYSFSLHQRISRICTQEGLSVSGDDLHFYTRLSANAAAIHGLYQSLYSNHLMADALFEKLLLTLIHNHQNRTEALRKRDLDKASRVPGF